MMKRLWKVGAFLMILLMCSFSVLPVYSAENSQKTGSEYEVYIDDTADLLTDDEEKNLEKQMSELTSYGNMMFSTVYLSDSDYEGNAEDAYFGKFGNEPGVNFQIDMGNRKLTLSASTEMEKLIGSERDSIVDNIYQYASDEEYAECASECFREIDRVLNKAQIAHKMKHISNAIVAVILGLILNFLVVFATFRGNVSKKYRKQAVTSSTDIRKVNILETFRSKRYSPIIHSSDGGGHGAGSGGGGSSGGGGFSGGSSSHGF